MASCSKRARVDEAAFDSFDEEDEQPSSSTRRDAPLATTTALELDGTQRFSPTSMEALRHTQALDPEPEPVQHRPTHLTNGKRKIQTFVFFDLETTGIFPSSSGQEVLITTSEHATARLNNLIHETKENDYPRITEFAMVAIDRETLTKSLRKMHDIEIELRTNDEDATRFVYTPANVHSRLINPGLTSAEWELYTKRQSRNSKMVLTKDDLERQRTLLQEWIGIRLFLENLPKPLCIIAHNGIWFDFRLLYGELRRHNVLHDAFPDEVYFLDSWHTFKDLDQQSLADVEHVLAEKNNLLSVAAASRSAEAVIVNPQRTRPGDNADIFESVPIDQDDVLIIHPVAETKKTPVKRPDSRSTDVHQSPSVAARRALFSPQKERHHRGDVPPLRSDHPLNFLCSVKWPPAKHNCVRQQDFMQNQWAKWTFDRHRAAAALRTPGTYGLEGLYKRNIGGHYNAHTAEADCQALAQVAMAYGVDFLTYADRVAARFPF
ncbi:unnamed protein product, partial [Mesorhabditis spiculigera]